MDVFTQLSDPYPFVLDTFGVPETSSLSDAGTCSVRRVSSHSDEEVILASSRPKKRAGRRVFKETRHPVYRGVRRRNNNKWVCELREPNKKSRIWLGTYPTAEMAARAHDVAALVYRGKSACLNFADSACRLPKPASTDAKDIRKAATEAAEAFRPPGFGGVCECSEDQSKEMVEEKVKDMQEMAARAHDVAALVYRGKSACLNFADSACRLPKPASTDAKDIRKAATEAAEAFRPPGFGGVCECSEDQSKEMVEEKVKDMQEKGVFYVDEEAVFDMPRLLVDMAEGLLLSPPPCLMNYGMDWEQELESAEDVPLWSFCI